MVSNGNLILTETSSAYPSLHNAFVRPKVNQQISKELQSNNRSEIVWLNVLLFAALHTGAVYGLYLFLFVCSWKTCIWTLVLIQIGGHGITAGAHRLWAHRCYKAKLPLRIFLMVCQSVAFQNHIYEWARDHRVHHKYTDTNADPHNSQRGFFFSHMGWLMVRKHKDVIMKGKTIDMSDLEADPVVMFQKKYYKALVLTFCFIVPAYVPWFFWGETWWACWYTSTVLRYAFTLNGTWLVNSVAHIWGTRPYDKTITPVESAYVSFITSGEGWHNYHHVFPWDYKTAELGNYGLNITKMMIDFFSVLGLAYDLKTVSEHMIKTRAQRTGDGSKIYPNFSVNLDSRHENVVWGWGDVDMKPEDIQCVKIHNKM